MKNVFIGCVLDSIFYFKKLLADNTKFSNANILFNYSLYYLLSGSFQSLAFLHFQILYDKYMIRVQKPDPLTTPLRFLNQALPILTDHPKPEFTHL
jgi:hypothetical protein